MVGALVAIAAGALVAGGVSAKPSGPGPGNAPNAKACQKGGWEDVVRSDGSEFASGGECTAYAAQGGTLQEKQQWENVGPTVLDLVSPDRPPYTEGTDYLVMPGSGSGDVTARLVAIDIVLAPGADATNNPQPVDTSTSGCQPEDYTAAGFQPGDVALLQRGTCTIAAKVALAEEMGASAVVIFNEGQAPGRTAANFGSVEEADIPVLSAAYGVGFELYQLTQAGSVAVHVVTNTTN